MVNAGSARKEVHVKVFAISDLHLSGGLQKPMDVFGPHWRDHFARISEDWRARVSPEDLVLLPGDFCWAMQLSQAMDDLHAVAALPGTKVLLRGNHDYWWSSLTRVREALPEGMYALQNDAMTLEGITFCGSRGWTCPQNAGDTENERLYARELLRLRMSLECARKRSPDGPVVALTHFPPLGEGGVRTRVSDLMAEFHVNDVVYGHLHGASIKTAYSGQVDGVRYHYVACDGLGFKLAQITQSGE